MAVPARGLNGHGAAGAATDPAGHEFLERDLARQREFARQPCGRGEHGCRPAGEDFGLGELLGGATREPGARQIGDEAVVTAGIASARREPRRHAQSSSSGMQPMASSGMPGTKIVDGRTRNGKGSSEPMSTSGFQPAACPPAPIP